MSQRSTGLGEEEKIEDPKFMYVMPGTAPGGVWDDAIDLRRLYALLCNKIWQILLFATVITLLAVVYVIVAEEWYRAEVLVAPSDEQAQSALASRLGGLAVLAGIGGGEGKRVEAVATLRSRKLAAEFVIENDLVKVFFDDQWDAAAGRWKTENLGSQPDITDAVRYLHEVILNVAEDRATGLVTVSVEWKDPEVAAIWADDLVRRANAAMRNLALRDAERNVTYLKNALKNNTVVSLQQTLTSLLESELQKLMLAQGEEEYAFRVIDPPVPQKEPVRPRRELLVLAAMFFGLALPTGYFVLRGFLSPGYAAEGHAFGRRDNG
jgi:uncharacterized protein involved in exopolysaccharide biosynthesis